MCLFNKFDFGPASQVLGKETTTSQGRYNSDIVEISNPLRLARSPSTTVLITITIIILNIIITLHIHACHIIHTCIYIYIWIRIHIHVYIYIYIHIHTYLHIHISIYVHTHTHCEVAFSTLDSRSLTSSFVSGTRLEAGTLT